MAYTDESSYTFTELSREDVWDTYSSSALVAPWDLWTAADWEVNTHADHKLPVPSVFSTILPIETNASHLRPGSVTPPSGGGNGTGGGKIVNPVVSGGENKSNESGGSKPLDPMTGYDEVVQINYLLIILLYVLGIVAFIYRRKKEKEEEEDDLERMNRM